MNALRIDGKYLAETILNDLSNLVKRRNIRPHLVVIIIGNNPASHSYIRQKQNAATRIGAKCTVIELPETTTSQELETIIHQLNNDAKATGIIVQLPLPPTSPISPEVMQQISPRKDVDGFVPGTVFSVPVAEAVIMLLDHAYKQISNGSHTNFTNWLHHQQITIIGKGKTAGKPIADIFQKLSIQVTIIDSTTTDPEVILKTSTVIISCVGREHVIKSHMISPGAILLSVGISRGEDNKLHGDYDEEAIKDIVQAYTPTPGGVGPVNVACLMKNLVKAITMYTLSA